MGIPTWALSAKWIQRLPARPGPQPSLVPPGKTTTDRGPFCLSTSSVPGSGVAGGPESGRDAEPLPHPPSPPVTHLTANSHAPGPGLRGVPVQR